MTTATAFVANTNQLTLTGLKSDPENQYLNTATVTVTVKDSTGTNVTGISWPLTMSYVAASNGDYSTDLTSSLSLVANSHYVAYIEADASTTSPAVERIAHWEFPFKAKKRTGATSTT